MEGGPDDHLGRKLYSLQDAAAGRHPYYCVASAPGAFPDMTPVCIPSINEHYGKNLQGMIVDIGDPDYFPDQHHLDIFTADETASEADLVNLQGAIAVVWIP